MQKQMIEFKRFHSTDGAFYSEYFPDGYERGCEFSFANLYLWGKQNYAVFEDSVLLMSQFGQRTVYLFPVGNGDKAAAVREIMRDAEARGLVFRMSGISPEAREMLEAQFPDTFRFHTDEGSYDYVYLVDDLAELKGKTVAGPKGTVLHQILVSALKAHGLSAKDVKFVQMGIPKGVAAMKNGSVDAALVAANFLINCQNEGDTVLATAKGYAVKDSKDGYELSKIK